MTEYRTEFEDTNDLMAYLMEQGALEITGIEEDGQFLLTPNLEKAKEVCPEFYEQLIADRDKDLLELYEAGIIDFQYNDDMEAVVTLTELGRKIAEESE